MRNLIILLLVAISLAVLRWLISDVVRAVKQSMAGSSSFQSGSRQRGGQAGSQTQAGHLVRDPISGTYIDQRMAIKETIDGQTLYFESKENRDAYLKRARSA